MISLMPFIPQTTAALPAASSSGRSGADFAETLERTAVAVAEGESFAPRGEKEVPVRFAGRDKQEGKPADKSAGSEFGAVAGESAGDEYAAVAPASQGGKANGVAEDDLDKPVKLQRSWEQAEWLIPFRFVTIPVMAGGGAALQSTATFGAGDGQMAEEVLISLTQAGFARVSNRSGENPGLAVSQVSLAASTWLESAAIFGTTTAFAATLMEPGAGEVPWSPLLLAKPVAPSAESGAAVESSANAPINGKGEVAKEIHRVESETLPLTQAPDASSRPPGIFGLDNSISAAALPKVESSRSQLEWLFRSQLVTVPIGVAAQGTTGELEMRIRSAQAGFERVSDLTGENEALTVPPAPEILMAAGEETPLAIPSALAATASEPLVQGIQPLVASAEPAAMPAESVMPVEMGATAGGKGNAVEAGDALQAAGKEIAPMTRMSGASDRPLSSLAAPIAPPAESGAPVEMGASVEATSAVVEGAIRASGSKAMPMPQAPEAADRPPGPFGPGVSTLTATIDPKVELSLTQPEWLSHPQLVTIPLAPARPEAAASAPPGPGEVVSSLAQAGYGRIIELTGENGALAVPPASGNQKAAAEGSPLSTGIPLAMADLAPELVVRGVQPPVASAEPAVLPADSGESVEMRATAKVNDNAVDAEGVRRSAGSETMTMPRMPAASERPLAASVAPPAEAGVSVETGVSAAAPASVTEAEGALRAAGNESMTMTRLPGASERPLATPAESGAPAEMRSSASATGNVAGAEGALRVAGSETMKMARALEAADRPPGPFGSDVSTLTAVTAPSGEQGRAQPEWLFHPQLVTVPIAAAREAAPASALSPGALSEAEVRNRPTQAGFERVIELSGENEGLAVSQILPDGTSAPDSALFPENAAAMAALSLEAEAADVQRPPVVVAAPATPRAPLGVVLEVSGSVGEDGNDVVARNTVRAAGQTAGMSREAGVQGGPFGAFGIEVTTLTAGGTPEVMTPGSGIGTSSFWPEGANVSMATEPEVMGKATNARPRPEVMTVAHESEPLPLTPPVGTMRSFINPEVSARTVGSEPVLLSQAVAPSLSISTLRAERPVPAPEGNLPLVGPGRPDNSAWQAAVVVAPVSADSEAASRQYSPFTRALSGKVEKAAQSNDPGRAEFSSLMNRPDNLLVGGTVRESVQAQATAVADIPTPLPEARIVEQVVSRVKMAGAGGETNLSMVLHPKELGEVRVELVSGKEGLRAHLHSQTQVVQEVLERNLPRLREAFESQGLRISGLQVSCDERRDGGNSAFPQREQGSQPQVHYRMTDTGNGTAEVEWPSGLGVNGGGWSATQGFSLRV